MTVLTSGQVLQNGKYSYTIERELARGRSSISYLAQRSDSERWVIKILNPQVLVDLSESERDRQESLFWQEAIKLSKCSGTPHIAKFESPFKEGPVLCLPVEYLKGDSLAKRPDQQLVEETALDYIRQIGNALTVVHKQGLIHRDICPTNIYLRSLPKGKSEAVLTNFELAVDTGTVLSRTRTRELTDGFSPIELCTSGQTIGPYTDVYSLAATLYELLTGEIPCSAEDRMLMGKSLRSPQAINSLISDRTTKAIMIGMKLSTKKRPQSVQKWLSRLKPEDEEFKEEESESTDWGKWQAIWAAAAVFVALFAILQAWLPLRKSNPQSTPQVAPVPQATPTEEPSSQLPDQYSKFVFCLPIGEPIDVA